MTNGHGNAQGGAAVAKLTPESHLEEILNEIKPQEAASFKEHLEYLSPQNRARMRYDQFVTVQGGTEKMFDDIYHNAYQAATQSKIRGKGDPKSVADSLELVVIGALKQINRPTETFLWKNFETMKFTSDDDRLSNLITLAQYIGADQQELAQLIAGLKTGDPGIWSQSVRAFTNNLKDGMIDRYISQHRNRVVNQDNEHRFKAYMVGQLREQHSATPKDLPKYISPQNPVEQAVASISRLQAAKDPQAYAALGLQQYKQPDKK